MNLVPRRVVVPISIAAVVLCGVLAPIQWAQGNTARALFLGVLALTSMAGLWSTLRRPATQPAPTTPAQPTEPVSEPVSSSTPMSEDPRWHVETLTDQLPDPADRRKVRRWFIAFGVVCLAGVIACCVGAARTGDLSLIGFAVLLAVPVLVIAYGVGRNGFDL